MPLDRLEDGIEGNATPCAPFAVSSERTNKNGVCIERSP
jgi:hypothetical protein